MLTWLWTCGELLRLTLDQPRYCLLHVWQRVINGWSVGPRPHRMTTWWCNMTQCPPFSPPLFFTPKPWRLTCSVVLFRFLHSAVLGPRSPPAPAVPRAPCH